MARGSKPGERRGGRKKGTPNHVTTDARKAMQAAFDGIGGVTTLIDWANENPTEFYKLWGRLIPKELEHTGNPDKPLGVTLRFGKTEIPL